MWVIAADHAAIDLKNRLKAVLEADGLHVLDRSSTDHSSTDNYAHVADRLSADILEGRAEWGVLLCGSGIGSSMRANRHKGIRAAMVTSEYMAEMCRAHNNANVLVMGSRITTPEQAARFLKIFRATAFEGGRHAPRVESLDAETSRKDASL